MIGDQRYDPAEGWLRTIENTCGARPTTCPWQAYSDPECVAVLNLYEQCQTSDGAHVASLLPLDPHSHTYEGVVFYASALKRARGEAMRRAEKRREQTKQAKGFPIR